MSQPAFQSPPDGSVAVILPAAGSGQRFGAQQNKLFALLDDQPLWFHAARRLSARREVGRLVMPIAAADRDHFADQQHERIAQLSIELVDGGAERTDSVRAGLQCCQGDPAVRWVAIHDAARPLVADDDLAAVFAQAAQCGAAMLATPVTGTLKRLCGDHIETVDRRQLWMALTPQVFEVGLLRQAYAKHNGRPATDDAELVERIGHPVRLVPGSADNLKITYPEDLLVAAAILTRQNQHA